MNFLPIDYIIMLVPGIKKEHPPCRTDVLLIMRPYGRKLFFAVIQKMNVAEYVFRLCMEMKMLSNEYRKN